MDIQTLAKRYRRYCAWCRASGFEAFDWPEYKASRMKPRR